jgi:ribonuclease E
MAKKMLIDATHSEETRVVVVSGNRLEEYDFETSTKKQVKGNIYLAKVTRVEPSLQACFVEFGGNRHGFLAFGEIHPDYWQIPVADREALMAEERRLAERDDEDDDAQDERGARRGEAAEQPHAPSAEATADAASTLPVTPLASDGDAPADAGAPVDAATAGEAPPVALDIDAPRLSGPEPVVAEAVAATPSADAEAMAAGEPLPRDADAEAVQPPAKPESVGGEHADDDEDDDDEDEETSETRRRRFKPMRHYKIQEVIKRRQVLLVQVVKEERGTKGAALTTYISLAGRYCVLMPNTTRGGGISRRITSQQDRKRLKEIMQDLEVPDGMAVILRTAGMERAKPDIRRDYEYLMRLWDDVRDLTLNSRAPALVYEEGSLIKRSIRDLYSRDIDEIQVEGREGFEAARSFMRMLMPDHADRIRLYDDPQAPLFQRHQVEAQLDEMHDNTVRLRSGGYIVLNQTEALVAIDVNSGRATRERHIEETALKTNLEAADEVARQVRLRDLAGLIVIDFIDMEDNRHIAQVERRLKEAMRTDRARIQIGRISPFGLLEMSRQRLRPSLEEVSSQKCPHCGGSGFIRSTESAALRVLRGIEEEGMKSRAAALKVSVPAGVAVYILNHKRATLSAIEQRHGLEIAFEPDDTLVPPNFRLERVRQRERGETGPAPVRAGAEHAPSEASAEAAPAAMADEARTQGEFGGEPAEQPARWSREPRGDEQPEGEGGDEGGRGRGRRRRRRRGRGGRGREDGFGPQGEGPRGDFQAGDDAGDQPMPQAAVPASEVGEFTEAANGQADQAATGPEGSAQRAPRGDGDEEGRRRRRGRRGGRRRRQEDGDGQGAPMATAPVAGGFDAGPGEAPPPPAAPSYDDDLRARRRPSRRRSRRTSMPGRGTASPSRRPRQRRQQHSRPRRRSRLPRRHGPPPPRRRSLPLPRLRSRRHRPRPNPPRRRNPSPSPSRRVRRVAAGGEG